MIVIVTSTLNQQQDSVMTRVQATTEMTVLERTLFSGYLGKVRRSLTMTFLVYKFNSNSMSANLTQISQMMLNNHTTNAV